MNEQLKKQVREVVELLVHGRYSDIEKLTKGVRLSVSEMATAIADYGRHLISPPDNAFGFMHVVEIRNVQPPRWSVVMPLWTQEEGRSDLSLELTIIRADNSFAVQLDDIHVL